MRTPKIIHFIYLAIIAALVAVGSAGAFQPIQDRVASVAQKRATIVAMNDQVQARLLPAKGYRCCLATPCSICVEKTPGHGVGATCDCLADIMNGRHPCSECLGEILEGHGNPLISEYFAEAIAEEVGRRYKPLLMKIIADKYGMPIERQL